MPIHIFVDTMVFNGLTQNMCVRSE